ncbi:TIR domain-containing protein [Foetidibacter luteolus]|uniref:TIR domain-containing protein n=1 Tax=Foetidibacter luteolus TaxID=2608880 RepID=UPI001A99252E|nr:TIR domain-containing protein [Foetidibacter luteolus]
MKIFLSWSGDSSKTIAFILQKRLKQIFPELELWMSAYSIEAGEKWGKELDVELQSTSFGIICLTPENLAAPWLLFEAGALSKSFDSTGGVVPYCYKIAPASVQGPLAQFQGVPADEKGSFSLVAAINNLVKNKREKADLQEMFDAFWPQWRKSLDEIAVKENKGPEYIELKRVFCGITADFATRGGDKDIAILKENFGDKVTVAQDLSLRALRNTLLSGEFELVHLVGEVDRISGEFMFTEKERISPEGLSKLLQNTKARLVILATCDSLILGAELSRHMNVVSGINTIQVDNIVTWEECFYHLLGQRKSLTTAYDLAQGTAKAPMVILFRNDVIFG